MTADTTHEVFRQPDDPTSNVWRYMDFTKYAAMLESSSLYFARIDKLGDPFEGSMTVPSITALEGFIAWPADSVPPYWNRPRNLV